MIGAVEQDLVQASPIKDFVAPLALCEVLFFFERQLFVFVQCHLAAALMRGVLPKSARIDGIQSQSAVSRKAS